MGIMRPILQCLFVVLQSRIYDRRVLLLQTAHSNKCLFWFDSAIWFSPCSHVSAVYTSFSWINVILKQVSRTKTAYELITWKVVAVTATESSMTLWEATLCSHEPFPIDWRGNANTFQLIVSFFTSILLYCCFILMCHFVGFYYFLFVVLPCVCTDVNFYDNCLTNLCT